ncbi:hypothetical protein [Sphingobacterium athyrii]|uniref:Uncharacterized protein n=1 Tax=Sphingobacterium athyrii TaxID=2152717 RepID=A0A363NV00_9SPHI|nr:hypothetical protein [Sphingobacterium athyrii]PUV24570.1 hypothetical protein DCO56_14610 [Sphingobacterium athyrii]
MGKLISLFNCYYFIGIFIFALMVNLGSAWPYPMSRLERDPIMVGTIAATIPLTVLYLYFIALISHRLQSSGNRFVKQRNGTGLVFFVSCTALPIWLCHLLVLYFTFTAVSAKSLFSAAYFAADFWFFAIPLISYCSYLYFYPLNALFTFKNSRVLEEEQRVLRKQIGSLTTTCEDLSAAKRRMRNEKDELLRTKEVLSARLSVLESRESEVLQLWRQERSVDVLFTYFQQAYLQYPLDFEGDLCMYHIVLVHKSAGVYFVILVNGMKMLLNGEGQLKVLANPWFVNTSQNVLVNMLFCKKELIGIPNRQGNKLLQLRPPYRTSLEEVYTCSKLDGWLISTRRLKDNFIGFWDYNNLRKMDESRLLERFNI